MTASAATQGSTDPIRTALAEILKWSDGQPVWQRDALRRLYLTGRLDDADLTALAQICRESNKLADPNEIAVKPDPLEFTHFPAKAGPSAPVTLESVNHAQFVNALAEGQALNFADSGLNIVYGDNGSGKSGYGRILKRACRARNQEEIVRNVYASGATGPASASIQFSVAGKSYPVVPWTDGSPAPSVLSGISVFDAKCASVHVDESNQLAYTPTPLRLLQQLAGACRKVSELLKAKKPVEALPSFRLAPLSHEATAVDRMVRGLTPLTKMSDVRTLSLLSETEKVRMEELKRALASDPAKQLRRCQLYKTRLEALIKQVKFADEIVSDVTSESLRTHLRDAAEKASAAKFAATEAFKNEPLPAVGSNIWKALWESARKYSTTEAYPASPFPKIDLGAVCVMCQQSLSDEAADRLTRFEQFVQQNAQQAAGTAKRAVEAFKNGLSQKTASKETLREAVTLLRDELDREPLCRDVVRYLARGRVRARHLALATDAAMVPTAPTAQSVLVTLEDVLAAANRRIAVLEKAQRPEQRKIQENELHELQDRAWLATILTEVEQEIERVKKVAAFNRAIGETDTTRITRKTTELSETLVTGTMRDAFAAEVNALGLADRRIELVQDQSSYGTTRFKVALVRNPNEKVGRVLSEGEHRCIALAAFLAELSTENSASGLVFEDPVSSLDHNYRDVVASRLISEAATGRQLIIFTHDIGFFMLLDELAREKQVPTHYQTINRTAESAGICESGNPAKTQSVPTLLAACRA